jgi:hypothetical protein
MRRLVIVLCLATAAACDESFTGPTVPLNQEFELAPGGVARVEEAALSVRFNGVRGDSRCPADAFCVQGGDAIVDITVLKDGNSRNFELHTGTMAPVRYDDVTIALVQLAPYPFSSRTIQPDEYRATLKATR